MNYAGRMVVTHVETSGDALLRGYGLPDPVNMNVRSEVTLSDGYHTIRFEGWDAEPPKVGDHIDIFTAPTRTETA